MEQSTYDTQMYTPPLKPNNHLVLAILCTACFCLPLGIVSIVNASKVNGLYMSKQYEAATLAAKGAKKWSLIGIVLGLVVYVVNIVIYVAEEIFAYM